MKNKKGFQTQNLIIGGVLLSAVIFIISLSFTAFSANYPDNPTLVNENMITHYSKLTEQTEDVKTMQSESTSEEGLGIRGALGSVFGSFFTVILLMFNSITLIGGMAGNLVGDFGFLNPTIMKVLLVVTISILSTMLVIKLINSIGRNPI